MLRANDPQGSGKVEIDRSVLEQILGVDRSTIYRWLQEGRKVGAFQAYTRNGETFTIYLGSKVNVCLNLGLADWGAATEMTAEEIAGKDFREEQTRRQTHHLQRRSENAAKEQARAEGDRRPKLAKFRSDHRRGTAERPALQYLRGHRETGASQIGIGESLGISDRTVRRHLEPVDRQQCAHKVPYGEGWAEIQKASEEGYKPQYFIREGEAWKLGCNLYDLDYTQKSEWTQRLKYKFKLLQNLASRRTVAYNLNLLIKNFCCDWFQNLNLDLDTLIAKAGGFKEFMEEVKREIRRTRRQNRGR